MGMFDTISVADSLPYSEEMVSLGLDKNVFNYQTKDLHCLMDEYVVQNKKLFCKKFKVERWVEGDKTKKNFLERFGHMEREEPYYEDIKYHGEIYFYDFVQNVNGKWDCWVEYKAAFTNGELTGLNLFKFEKTDNTERLEKEKNFKETIQKENNKIINKYFLHTAPVWWCRRRIGFWLQKLGQKIINISYKL